MAQIAETERREYQGPIGTNHLHDRAIHLLETYGIEKKIVVGRKESQVRTLTIHPSFTLEGQPAMIIRLISVSLGDKFSIHADHVDLGIYETITDINNVNPRQDIKLVNPDGTTRNMPYLQKEYISLFESNGKIRAIKDVMGTYGYSYREDVTNQGLKKIDGILDYISAFAEQVLKVRESEQVSTP